ncbi:MAG: ATP-binding protein [Ignavibacteria bacterium]|nr:ATP-binding protein [Ignavibacteria bacterium]
MHNSENQKKSRILIVEASTKIAVELKKHLLHLQYDVVAVCESAESAVKEAAENEIDLALMDIDLKGEMDGIETAQILIEQYEVPVVFLTSHTDEQTLIRAKQTKPYGYIVKPFIYVDLKSTIEIALYKSITDKKIKESEYLFKALVENSRDGIFIIQNLSIVYANDSFANIFGYSLDEVIDKNFESFIANDDWHKVCDNYRNPINESTVQKEYEIKGLHKNREIELIINLSAGIIIYKDAPAVMGTAKDITKKKQTELALLEAKELSEQSDKLKTEFLGQISHEIRTPINNIIGFSYLIQEELGLDINDNIKNCFKIMESAGKRLVKTIDQIIQMAQLKTGDHSFSPEIIDIDKDILEDLCFQFFQMAKEKQLQFNYQNYAVSQLVHADKYMLNQIISNLIDNAIKYTNEGSIDISVYNILDNKMVVEIRDTGVGISKEYLKNIYIPFTQEEAGYTRSYNGNGLGMALCKNYANINNIEMIINSEKGKGSSFRLIINSIS